MGKTLIRGFFLLPYLTWFVGQDIQVAALKHLDSDSIDQRVTVPTNNNIVELPLKQTKTIIKTNRLLSDDLTRIVGGTPASNGEFPSYGRSLGTSLCGASLIHPDIVLTAAHCGLDAFVVGVLISGTDATNSESFGIAQFITHPNFDIITKDNDIMILKLSALSTAPIQPLNFDPTVPSDNEPVTTIGYGLTDPNNNSSTSNVLLKVSIPVVSDDVCAASYGTSYNPVIHICAGEVGKDSCQGDSGGPLLTNDVNVQVGIVSFGVGCGEPGFPGIYTRVSAYEDFIRQQICDLSSVPPFNCTNATVTTSPSPTTSLLSTFAATSIPTSIRQVITSSPSALSSIGTEVPTLVLQSILPSTVTTIPTLSTSASSPSPSTTSSPFPSATASPLPSTTFSPFPSITSIPTVTDFPSQITSISSIPSFSISPSVCEEQNAMMGMGMGMGMKMGTGSPGSGMGVKGMMGGGKGTRGKRMMMGRKDKNDGKEKTSKQLCLDKGKKGKKRVGKLFKQDSTGSGNVVNMTVTLDEDDKEEDEDEVVQTKESSEMKLSDFIKSKSEQTKQLTSETVVKKLITGKKN